MSKIYKRLLKQSINSLRKSGVKSFLTLLGIFIGSATIILVYELGAAAQQSIEQQYSNMSVKTIIINGPSTGGEKSNLSINDLEPLTNINVIDKVAPQLTGRLIVSSSLESPSLNIFGTDINMVDVGNLELQQGRFFDDIENKNKSKVVVLGYESAQLLFGETFETITGETVTINRKSYEVIGVLKYKGGSFGSVTIDDSVFIPYSVAERYILGNSGKFSINVIVDDFNNLVLAQNEISRTLRDLHNIRGADTEDFKIKDMGSVVQSAQESAKTMSILLWSDG